MQPAKKPYEIFTVQNAKDETSWMLRTMKIHMIHALDVFFT